jgi:hypothetical protein
MIPPQGTARKRVRFAASALTPCSIGRRTRCHFRQVARSVGNTGRDSDRRKPWPAQEMQRQSGAPAGFFISSQCLHFISADPSHIPYPGSLHAGDYLRSIRSGHRCHERHHHPLPNVPAVLVVAAGSFRVRPASDRILSLSLLQRLHAQLRRLPGPRGPGRHQPPRAGRRAPRRLAQEPGIRTALRSIRASRPEPWCPAGVADVRAHRHRRAFRAGSAARAEGTAGFTPPASSVLSPAHPRPIFRSCASMPRVFLHGLAKFLADSRVGPD